MRNSSSIVETETGASAKLFNVSAARRFLIVLAATVLLAAGQAEAQAVQPVAAGNTRGAPGQTANQNTGPADGYRLGSGDRVRVTVFGSRN